MGRRSKVADRFGQPVDVENTVVAVRYCAKCGLNLRGRPADGQCPTCGYSIHDSVYGRYVVDSDRSEARELLDGANVVLYPVGLVSGLTALGMLTTLLGARDFPNAVEDVFNVGLFFATLGSIVAATGIVLLTDRHPMAYYRARYGNLGFLLKLAAGLVGLAAALIAAGRYCPRPCWQVLHLAFFTIPSCIFLSRLQALMRRLPNLLLARYAKVAYRLTCVLAAAALAIVLLRPLAYSHVSLSGFVTALTLLAVTLGLVLLIWVMRLLLLVRKALLWICR